MPKKNSQVFHVQPDKANHTLAAALRAWLPGTAWSEVRRMIRTRQVMIDGNLCLDAGRRLKPKEVVKILPHSAAPLPREDDVKIRYLDQHVIVVEKPAGMTSVRHAEERDWNARRKQLQPPLEEVLPRIIARKQNKGKHKSQQHRTNRLPPVRPVHRLDRETSGLMVFARTVVAERHLGQQFRKHTTGRRYLAIAQGKVGQQTIESQLIRDRGDGRRGSTTDAKLGKRAVTHVKPLEDLNGYTLIECQLETGRTHQIRIHLAEAGHPLCGEKVYHQPLFKEPMRDDSGAPRIALHAKELRFEHPISGEQMEFQMPLPQDLQVFLERLRKR